MAASEARRRERSSAAHSRSKARVCPPASRHPCARCRSLFHPPTPPPAAPNTTPDASSTLHAPRSLAPYFLAPPPPTTRRRAPPLALPVSLPTPATSPSLSPSLPLRARPHHRPPTPPPAAPRSLSNAPRPHRRLSTVASAACYPRRSPSRRVCLSHSQAAPGACCRSRPRHRAALPAFHHHDHRRREPARDLLRRPRARPPPLAPSLRRPGPVEVLEVPSQRPARVCEQALEE